MNKVELLAPAGSEESLIAAVQGGADAVYLGGQKFSARAYASNFDNEKMREAVNYCHKYGVKIYVTINTLIKDKEMNEAVKYAKFLHSIGVDALIIQDTGLANNIIKKFPELEVHASTQMTVHNGEGAKYLKEKGFERIVLSRELSLKEIEHISKNLNIETEVFVHGALCICYSGQCLMSSVIGGRSGNRGRCAQPCRLPYTLINTEKGTEKKAYLLSPKDICTIENMKEILESGTSSLKIEGRMKRPEYVAGVISSYRNAIDSAEKNKTIKLKNEKGKLMQLFNREGFSKAYLFGNIGKDMMAYKFPKNTGVRIGEVKGNEVILIGELSAGDGIRVGEKGFTVSKILRNGKEINIASNGDKVKILPKAYKNKDILYKTQDSMLLSELSKKFANKYERKINLTLMVSFKLNQPVRISTEYMGKVYYAEGRVIETPINKPLDKERIIKNLSKSGDTPFKFNKIIFEEFDEGFVPVGALNEIRREIVNDIEEDIIKNYGKSIESLKTSSNSTEEKVKSEKELPEYLAVVNTEEQLRAVIDSKISSVAVNIGARKEFIDDRFFNQVENTDIYLKVPNIIKDTEFERMCSKIDRLLDKCEGILTSNLGIINRYKEKTSIIGDYKLNIFNSSSIEFFNDSLIGAYLSPELNRKEIQEIISRNSEKYGILIYGKYELMVSEYCPIGSVFGGKSIKKQCCGECSNGSFKLRDRMGEEFSVITDINCRSYIYNNVPVYLINELEDIKKRNVGSFRLDFVDENYNDTLNIIERLFHNDKEVNMKKYTRGHYKRGVE